MKSQTGWQRTAYEEMGPLPKFAGAPNGYVPGASVHRSMLSGDNLYLADLEMVDFRQRQPQERELPGSV